MDDDVEALSGAARHGDSDAAARVIALCLPYWMSAARQIIENDERSHRAGAGPAEDPADLVQEALLKLLELWSGGQGPQSNTRSYVTATMRNAYANRLRSPRSREASIEAIELRSPFAATDDLRGVELSRERKIIRRAFGGLAQDHRAVLVATVIEGRKPSQLTEEFQRPAPAISNLLARAKQALARGVLVTQLVAGGNECAKNAEQLPNRVHSDISSHSSHERGISHVRGCDSCQRNWRRFAAISTAFGVLPLLALVMASDRAAPAAALAESDTDSSADGGRSNGQEPDGHEPNGQEPDGHEPNGPRSCSEGVTQTGRSPAVVSAPAVSAALVAALTTTEAANAASPARPPISRLVAALASTPALVVGIALIVVAAGAFLGGVALSQDDAAQAGFDGGSDSSNPYGADLGVSLSKDSDGTVTAINATFTTGTAAEWSMNELTLSLSPGTTFRSASDNLRCAATADLVTCRSGGALGGDEYFHFVVSGESNTGEFSLTVTGEIGGRPYVGVSNGQW